MAEELVPQRCCSCCWRCNTFESMWLMIYRLAERWLSDEILYSPSLQFPVSALIPAYAAIAPLPLAFLSASLLMRSALLFVHPIYFNDCSGVNIRIRFRSLSPAAACDPHTTSCTPSMTLRVANAVCRCIQPSALERIVRCIPRTFSSCSYDMLIS